MILVRGAGGLAAGAFSAGGQIAGAYLEIPNDRFR
jgi:hypothetical protein